MNIDISALKKTFNQKKVLDISHMAFHGNQIYGIVGPNGAGKTTLLKTIAGIEPFDSGSIKYNKMPLSKIYMKKMTYVSQQPYMLNTTVYNNIAYPLKLRKIDPKERDEQILDILNHLQIYHLRDRLATKLSAGETQKVALGRAVVFKPEVLLLDEPTANIDVNTLTLIEVLLRDYVMHHDMMVLYISHFQNQIDRLCDKVITMSSGEIIDIK